MRREQVKTNVSPLQLLLLFRSAAKLVCNTEASGFIGLGQGLMESPGLLSLFHKEPTLPGEVKQSMKLFMALWNETVTNPSGYSVRMPCVKVF